MKHFIFWQNILSPHQSPFLRELAHMGHKVDVVTVRRITPERSALGWIEPDMGEVSITVNPSGMEVSSIVNESPSGSIHVLAGARWTPLGALATKACISRGRRMGILSESADPRGFKGVARNIKYAAERLWRGRHYQFLLAMGQLGVDWFSICGYSRLNIFPFAYVTEQQIKTTTTNPNKVVRFVFVGQLIRRKGVDILLRALALSPRCELIVIGDGVERESLEAFARKCGVSDRVTWLGSMEAKGVQKQIVNSDVLVLPTREDGWGAVVNEALMAGTPVVCSDACGASDLIQHPWLGSIVPSTDVDALAESLSHWVRQGRQTEEERDKIRQWSRCISGEAVASYFVALMEHVYDGAKRPEAPWRN